MLLTFGQLSQQTHLRIITEVVDVIDKYEHVDMDLDI